MFRVFKLDNTTDRVTTQGGAKVMQVAANLNKRTKMKFFAKAAGSKGIIIRSAFDESLYFRVYHKDGKFDDFPICVHELQVEITDEDACFYETDTGELFIDYSPQTLGITNDGIVL